MSVNDRISNGEPSKRPNSKVAILVLLALLLLMGTIPFGVKMLESTCGPRPAPPPPPPVTENRKLFWKKNKVQEPEQEEEEEPSPLCRHVWTLVDYVKPLKEPPIEEQCEDITEEPKKKRFHKIRSIFKRKQRYTVSKQNLAELHSAFSDEMVLTKKQQELVQRLATQFRHEYPNHLDSRLAAVSWGGPSSGNRWWHENSGADGGALLGRYLRIMKWPDDLTTNFPFSLCSQGCSSTVAISHTLEWREKYKPWLISPAAMKENKDGIVYTHGYSKSRKGDHSGHALVWMRAGLKRGGVQDAGSYFRAILHALEHAVADTLHRSHQHVGKFNVVIDAHGVGYGMLPKLAEAKKAIAMLQDHFPDRLGMVILANLSKPAEFVLSIIKPLITKEVRDKLIILPSDATKRQSMLEAIIEPEFIPDYLGGTDTYRFNSDEYYHDKRLHFTDEEAKDYLTTMPNA